MSVKNIYELITEYAKCPVCGCEAIGEGYGTIEINTIDLQDMIFKRTCYCGWSVEIAIDMVVFE